MRLVTLPKTYSYDSMIVMLLGCEKENILFSDNILASEAVRLIGLELHIYKSGLDNVKKW